MTIFCWIFHFCLKTINSCVSLLFTNLFCANSKMFSVQKWKKAQKTISRFLSSLLRKLEKRREESMIKRCKTLFQIFSIIDKLYIYRPYLKPYKCPIGDTSHSIIKDYILFKNRNFYFLENIVSYMPVLQWHWILYFLSFLFDQRI